MTPSVRRLGTAIFYMQLVGITSDFDNQDVLDLDGDGLKTWEEYVAGTLENNSTSVFAVLSVQYFSDSNRVTYYCTPDTGVSKGVDMYRGTNLVIGFDPTPVATNLTRAADGTNVWYDESVPAGVPTFYQPQIPWP